MSYYSILPLWGSYIINQAKGLSGRTIAAGKISFGLRWTNLLKATIHCAQDFRRISQTASLVGISNSAEFCTVIERARQRARVRKHILEELSSLIKVANLIKLKWHKYWIT